MRFAPATDHPLLTVIKFAFPAAARPAGRPDTAKRNTKPPLCTSSSLG